MRLRLVNAGRTEIEDGVRADVHDGRPARARPPQPCSSAARRAATSSPPPAGTTVPPGGTWEFVATCGHRPAHANDGPESAYLTAADGSIRAVRTGATARLQVRRPEAPTYRAGGADARRGRPSRRGNAGCTPAPLPRCHRPASTSCTSTSTRRSGRTSTPSAPTCTSPPVPMSPCSGRSASSFAAARRRGRPATAPRHEWRGLHVDLARQFFPATDVAWLIDVAAWHGLNRLHLHLTDDEGWRVPVDGYPQLTEVGRLARPRTADPAAARLGQRALRRCLRARRDPDVGDAPRTRPASSSCRRSTCRGTASPPSPRCPSSPIPRTPAARSACSSSSTTCSIPVSRLASVRRGRVRLARRPVPLAVAARRWRRAAARRVGRVAGGAARSAVRTRRASSVT